jgi:hypothetical protein
MPTGEVMRGESRKHEVTGGPDYKTLFHFESAIGERPDQFTAIFPEFVLDGTRLHLPPVSFNKSVRHEFMVVPNC